MTIKTVTLAKNQVGDITKSTILKAQNDIFIVSELEESRCTNVVDEALFGRSAVIRGQYQAPAQYNLVSFLTGGRFFGENHTLQDLIKKIEAHGGFKIVREIEFIER
ncbi:TPA: hypothetical protein ROX91_002001 [Bacillus cereus]|nr:hypothetical protein [Bacillus cereus]